MDILPSKYLIPDFYYCEEDEDFYIPTVKVLKVEDIAKEYNGDRPNAMVEYALYNQALDKIKYKKWADVIAFADEA